MNLIDLNGVKVLVDYAHTPDSVENALRAARPLAGDGRRRVVYGCGGDRDRGKRPLMGEAATGLADLSVVTSDNPRSEDPQAIIDEVLRGFDDSPALPHVEPDRTAAIAWALEQAGPGDSVVIAGKGHERVQIVGSEQIPFDDASVCRKVLARVQPAAAPWADIVPV